MFVCFLLNFDLGQFYRFYQFLLFFRKKEKNMIFEYF